MFTIKQAWLNAILKYFRENRTATARGYRRDLYKKLMPDAPPQGMNQGYYNELVFHILKLVDEGFLAMMGEWFRVTALGNGVFGINQPWASKILEYFRVNTTALAAGYRPALYALIHPGAGPEGMTMGFYDELDRQIYYLVDDKYMAEITNWFRVTAKGYGQ